ncbi:MAG: outer membrane beta-barrel protein [Vicinamibacterales bacterium]
MRFFNLGCDPKGEAVPSRLERSTGGPRDHNQFQRLMRRTGQFVLLVCLLLLPDFVSGQVSLPSPLSEETRARVRIGGIQLNPTIALSNAGSDNNVFNSVDDPQRDFTATVTPAADVWARVGRARIAARGRADLIYFAKFASERSVDAGVGSRLEFPLNRIVPWAEIGTFSGRQRAGYEIDQRSRRRQNDFGLGLDVRVAPKTTVGLGLRRATTTWDGDATFLGNSLAIALDRTQDSTTFAYRQQLTVLTTLAFDATAATERFDFSPDRDTDSVGIMVGFDLNTRALISGRVRVGAKKVDPVGGGFAPFKGVVANALTGYTLRGTTRLELEVARETMFSYDLLYPFFVQTGAKGTVTQRVSSSWDVQVRIGRQGLAYEAVRGRTDLLRNRIDHVDQRGGGVGYRFKWTIRVGLNFDWMKRSSLLSARDYGSFRIGAAVTNVR